MFFTSQPLIFIVSNMSVGFPFSLNVQSQDTTNKLEAASYIQDYVVGYLLYCFNRWYMVFQRGGMQPKEYRIL